MQNTKKYSTEIYSYNEFINNCYVIKDCDNLYKVLLDNDDAYIIVDVSKRDWEIYEFDNVELPPNDAAKQLLFVKVDECVEENKVSDYDVREEQGIFGYGY